jgi:hypothetical protein
VCYILDDKRGGEREKPIINLALNPALLDSHTHTLRPLKLLALLLIPGTGLKRPRDRCSFRCHLTDLIVPSFATPIVRRSNHANDIIVGWLIALAHCPHPYLIGITNPFPTNPTPMYRCLWIPMSG